VKMFMQCAGVNLRFLIWSVAIYTNVLKKYFRNRMHFYCCRLCKVNCIYNYTGSGLHDNTEMINLFEQIWKEYVKN
jgi:hypothetical protein